MRGASASVSYFTINSTSLQGNRDMKMKYNIGCNCFTVHSSIHSIQNSFRISSQVSVIQCCPVQLLWCQFYSCRQLIVKLYVGANVAPIKHFMAKFC